MNWLVISGRKASMASRIGLGEVSSLNVIISDQVEGASKEEFVIRQT